MEDEDVVKASLTDLVFKDISINTDISFVKGADLLGLVRILQRIFFLVTCLLFVFDFDGTNIDDEAGPSLDTLICSSHFFCTERELMYKCF